jgi:diguanylate cyclase (GGDEF)-like protein
VPRIFKSWLASLSSVVTRSPPPAQDPLEGIKRKAYLIATLSGLPAILLVWLSAGPTGFVARVAFPLFILLYLACVSALWSRAISIRTVERATFWAGVLFAFAQLFYVLYSSANLLDARTTITEVSYTTLTFLYVAAYLVFDSRTALRISLTLFAVELSAVVVKALSEPLSGLNSVEVSWLVRMHAFMGAIIALAYAMSYLKDQLSLQKDLTEAMHLLAHTDPLTGVANRREILSELRKETGKSMRYERPLSVVLFDLDHFKDVNDAHGHDHGDIVLREVVRAERPVLRASDRLGRWGGEEFIVLAPETDVREAGLLAERLRTKIADRISDSSPAVTASLGFAEYEAGDTPEVLIKRADQALYKAKLLGRNRAEAAD